MTSTYTTNKSIEKPANGDYVNTWSIPVNNDWDIIDRSFGGTTLINAVAASGTIILTATQYQAPSIIISGTLSANVNYQFPAGIGGNWTIYNNTSGAFSITISSGGGGTSGTIPQGYRAFLNCDGTNMSAAVTTSGTFLASALRLAGSTSGYVGLQAPATSGSLTFTLPAADGSANQFLQTNGAGVLGWASATSSSNAYTRTNYVATAGQTTFVVTYTVPFVLVWVNGVLQSYSDYTATSGTDVVLASACVVGDLVEFVSFTTATIANTMLTNFSNATAANPATFGGTGLTSPGSAGNFLTSTGTTWQSSTVATVRGAVGIGISSRKTANYTAVAGDYLACDTIAVGAFTVTLPATPVAGDKPIVIFDAGTTDTANGFATNNLTVARNGSTIHTLAEDAIISTKGVCVTFEYINGTWRVRIG